MLSAKTLILYILTAGFANCQCPDVSSIIAHDGTPIGSEEVIDGGEKPYVREFPLSEKKQIYTHPLCEQ